MLPRLNQDGFALVLHLVPPTAIQQLDEALARSPLARSRAGMRNALAHPAVASIAAGPEMRALAEELCGPGAFAFRATLFDKSAAANWRVTWHQDKALPLAARREIQGWGPWTLKAGVWHALAPARALEPIVALRLHLDASYETNGPLRVLPGTHSLGVLTDAEIDRFIAERQPVTCTAPRGSVVAMRPLVLHASSKATSLEPRRVLHIEYAPAGYQPDPLLELATA